jgi:hypothetical protein
MMDTRDAYRQALHALADKARTAVPALNGRVEGAVKLVLAGDVTLLEDGTARVCSGSEPLTTYKVGASCTCRDFSHAPRGLCRHKLAALMQYRLAELLPPASDADEPWPEPADASDLQDVSPVAQEGEVAHVAVVGSKNGACGEGSLPEAPASVNVRLTILGHDVQFTLRDHDEGALLARLEALLRKVQTAPAPLLNRDPGQAQTPICPWHGAMKESTKAKGTWYCPAKMADGSYCTERSPAHGGRHG